MWVHTTVLILERMQEKRFLVSVTFQKKSSWFQQKKLKFQNLFCSHFSMNVCSGKMRVGTRTGLQGFSPNSYINTGWKSVQCLIRFFTATKWEQSKFIFNPLDLFISWPHPDFICTKESTPTKPPTQAQTYSLPHSPTSCFTHPNWYLC